MRVVSWLFDSEDSSQRRQTPKYLDSSLSGGSCSLHSTLSLQTLPSLPSLQKVPSENLTVTVISSVKLRKEEGNLPAEAALTPNKVRSCLPVTCLAVNDGYLFAVSGHEVSIYDHATCTHLDTFNGHDTLSGSVKSVGFCGEKIFTAHQDGKIGVWKLSATNGYKQLTTLPTFNDRLRRFALPRNYVQVRRHKKSLWIQHADAVTSLAVSNGFIYSVSWDKTLKIWRASDLRCQESIKAHDDAVNTVIVSTNGTVYTGSADRRIRVWAKPEDSKRHTLVASLEKHKSAVNALALNRDGSVLFSGSCDRSILVWEREDNSGYMNVTGALRGHEKAILSLFNVSDLLLSGSADRTVRIWRRGTGLSYCCLEVLTGHTKPVKSLAAVSDLDTDGVVSVVSGSLDGEVKCWKVSVTKPDNLIYMNGTPC